MFGECHAHIALDGSDYRAAMELHRQRVDESAIHMLFREYRNREITFVRDGGDAWGVSCVAKRIAPRYGLDYRSPHFAIHKRGHYGGIVGRGFDTPKEYASLVAEAFSEGADFIKIMTTGIMDFNHFGSIVGGPALDAGMVREMVHIAHESGLAVASHTNGAGPILDAVEAGVDNIEHGNYLNTECIEALAEKRIALVPTAAVACSHVGTGRFNDRVLARIVEASEQGIARAFDAGVILALGSDAGAAGVRHGEGLANEYAFLKRCVADGEALNTRLQEGESFISSTFKRR